MLFPCLYAWKMPWCSQRTSKHSFCLLSSLVPSVVLLLKSHPSTPDSKDVAVLFLSHFGSWPQGLHVIPSILTLDRLLFSWESRLSWELKKKKYRWTQAEQTFSCVSALDLIWWPPGPSESVLCAWQGHGSLWDSEVLVNHASWLDPKEKSLNFCCKGGAGAFSKLPFTNLFFSYYFCNFSKLFS